MENIISSLINNSENESLLIDIFSKLWDMEPTNAIKSLFFILDKDHVNRVDIFLKLFVWVKDKSPNTFYNNISHIVGVSNSYSIPDDVQKKMTKEHNSKQNDILDQFISKEYQNSFEQYSHSTMKLRLVESLGIPQYSSWETLIKLYNFSSKNCKEIPQKAKYIILNTFDKGVSRDKKNNVFSDAYDVLSKYPEIMSQTRIKSYDNNFPKEIPIKKEWTFQKRYAFIFIHN